MPKRNSNMPKGRCTAYSYFVKSCRQEVTMQNPNAKVVFADFSKECAERWKSLDAEERKVFVAMSDEDKIRYDMEMDQFYRKGGVDPAAKKRKAKVDKKVKPAASAYSFFSKDIRPRMKADNPSLSTADVTKEVKRMWDNLDGRNKRQFESMAKEDAERYRQEVQWQKDREEAIRQAATSTSNYANTVYEYCESGSDADESAAENDDEY